MAAAQARRSAHALLSGVMCHHPVPVKVDVTKRILFVDDEPPVLALLQALLRQVNPNWESAFVDRGARALSMLSYDTFDAVVSDMRMPEMNGNELLNQVRERYPGIARLILSGYADAPQSLRALEVAHQYVAKPFTLNALQNVLNRMFALDRFVPPGRVQEAVARLNKLPSAPAVTARIERELVAPGCSTESLAGILAQDTAMTLRMLQVTHSAFFGPPRPALTVKEAAQHLGATLVRTLASARESVWTEPEGSPVAVLAEDLNRHSVRIGMRASRLLAMERADPNLVKAAFTAGMLHDVGKLALACALPELSSQATVRAWSENRPVWQVEKEVIGINHAEAGAYLAGLWGLPEAVVDIIAYHHEPRKKPAHGFGPLAAVHVANWIETYGITSAAQLSSGDLDLDYVRSLGIDKGLARWLAEPEPVG